MMKEEKKSGIWSKIQTIINYEHLIHEAQPKKQTMEEANRCRDLRIHMCRMVTSHIKASSLVGPHTHTNISTVWLEAVTGLGIANIVELGHYGCEQSKSSSCPKNSLPQWWAIQGFTEKILVPGVVGIPYWTRKQAYLSNEEKHPGTDNLGCSEKDNIGSIRYIARNRPANFSLLEYNMVMDKG